MISYHKLIRDKVPEKLDKKNLKYKSHKASPEEFATKLKEKLLEEVTEYQKDNNAEELADILEVVYALANLHRLPKNELENIRLAKAQESGSFEKKIILEECE